MDIKETKKINNVEATLLGIIINQDTSRIDKSDQTIFRYEGGSVRSVIPTPPKDFNYELFKEIRHLLPWKNFSGRMIVNRKGGFVQKTIEFI